MNNVGFCILSEFMCFPSISINRFCSNVMDVEFCSFIIGKRILDNLYGSHFVRHKNFGLEKYSNLYGNPYHAFLFVVAIYILLSLKSKYFILLQGPGIVPNYTGPC